ncbi:MAG: cell division protein ZapA [Candidatus Poribacteria bacterium]
MSEIHKSVKVTIYGKEYEIKGNQDEEYIHKLADYVDSIMHNIAEKTQILAFDRIAILTALNIADEMHRQRKLFEENITRLERELQEALKIAIQKS